MIMAALAGVAWVWLAAGPAPAEDADLSVNVPGVTNPSPSRSGLEDEYDAPIPSPTSSPSSSASTSLAPIPSSTAPGGSPGGGANTGGGTVPGGGGDGDGDGDGDGACVQVEPALPLEPADDAWAAAVDKDLYLPSHKVTATASGFEVGERVQLALFSDPRLIGNFTADAEGRVEAVFAVADDAAPGTHSIQFTGWCGAVVARADVLVGVPADPPPDDGWPAWLWWLLALGLALALAWTIRRAVRAMRDRSDRAGVAAP
jgi:hypothetical protein